MLPLWNEIRVTVMTNLVTQKFQKNKYLAQLLWLTGDKTLVEGNNWGDTFWGVDLHSGVGGNHLGKILMNIRGTLSSE